MKTTRTQIRIYFGNLNLVGLAFLGAEDGETADCTKYTYRPFKLMLHLSPIC